MKQSKKYKTKSWSQQSRKLCDKALFYYYNAEYPNYGEKEAIEFFQNSYRSPLIKARASKRFGRIIRKGKMI